jgi:hypothetical protein
MSRAQISVPEIESLIPLSEYLARPEDDQVPQYPFLRCAGLVYGLWIYAGANFPEEEQERIRQNINDTTFVASLLGAARIAERSGRAFTDLAEDEIVEMGQQVNQQVLAIAEFYSSKMQRNFVQQGEAYGQDPLISGDLNQCAQFYQLAQAIASEYQ